MTQEKISIKCDNYDICKNYIERTESTIKRVRARKQKILCVDCKKAARMKYYFTKYREYRIWNNKRKKKLLNGTK